MKRIIKQNIEDEVLDILENNLGYEANKSQQEVSK